MAVTVALTAATATFTLTKNLTTNDSIKVGSRTYLIKETPSTTYDINLGANQTATITNIVAAINQNGTAGTNYYTGTLGPGEITATASSTTLITFTSKLKGLVGNNFECREITDGGTAFTCGTFAGGSGEIASSTGFIASLLSLTEVNAEVQQALKQLTYADD